MADFSTPLEEFIYSPDTMSLVMRSEVITEEYLAQNPFIRLGKTLYGQYSIVYLNITDLQKLEATVTDYVTNVFPIVLGLLDAVNLEAAGITQVQRQPYLELTGRGVLLGFVDTGVDYTNRSFVYEDGTSKIQYIWDQTIPGAPPEGYPYGSEYGNMEINAALRTEDPFMAVPHRDNIGHGTFLASVAGGRKQAGGELLGAAPDAEIIAVKLRRAKPADRARCLIPEKQENAYSSDDFMMGIQYITDKARELNRPVAICIAVGSNQGSHNGYNLVEEYLMDIAGTAGVGISAAVGNESQAGHHTQGKIAATGESKDIELRVGDGLEDIYMTMWNYSSDRLSVSVTSPAGESINRIPARSGISYYRKLTLERSSVILEYVFPVQRIGEQITRIKLLSATPGVWKITVYGDVILEGVFHIWLPLTGFINPDTVFLSPSPNYTAVTPATAIGLTACGSYNSQFDSLEPTSSWGPSRMPVILPDLVAPGVNVGGSCITGQCTMSGTSVAAAITAGASALMLQWGIVEKNNVLMDSFRIRARLIAGCDRDNDKNYPNNQWGYGKLNLYNVFRAMRPM